jgi:16S rRNA (guanine527-N7)-methyltransferase
MHICKILKKAFVFFIEPCYNVEVMDILYYKRLIDETYSLQFNKLFDLLIEHNKMYNLTAICEREEVYLKHFLDSVVGESYFKQGAKVIEIGSGGGFPSLPLKIIREDLRFTLVESTGKKCSYLQTCVDNLAFSDVKVVNNRAEELAKDKLFREKYDISVARAVARLNTLCEYCLPFVKVGGRFVAYKGDAEEEIKEAENAIKILGGEIEKVENYSLPNSDKRTLVVVKKISSTPPKYPRGQGKERKNPL